MSQQIKKWIQIVNDPQLNCELNTIHSSLLTVLPPSEDFDGLITELEDSIY